MGNDNGYVRQWEMTNNGELHTKGNDIQYEWHTMRNDQQWRIAYNTNDQQ